MRLDLADSEYSRVGYGLCKGDSEDTIMSNNTDITYSRFKYLNKELRYTGKINIRLGFLFEKWVALKMGVPIEKLDSILGGTSNNPDLIWNGVIYSIKYRINHKAKTIPFYQSKKGEGMKPEYDEALKQNTNYKLIFMNPKWSLDAQIIDIDPHGDDKIIVYRPP